MSRILAYIRTSTSKQDTQNQRLEILEFARHKKWHIDDFITISISARKTPKERRIHELLDKLLTSDTLIVTELSRIGRSTAEVIALVNQLVEKNIRIVVIKQNLDISQHDMSSKVIVTMFSLLAELERDLISSRTKEALAAKKLQGIKLGKPKGTLQKSKFDVDRERIEELLLLGLSGRKIAKLLNYSNPIGINKYIKSRGLRTKLPSRGQT